VVETAEASGIRFFTLAEDTSEEAVRKLYDLYARCAPDTPMYRLAAYPEYERWRQWMIDTESTCRETMILAADGDQVVACSVMVKTGGGGLYVDYTCVDRAYRNRHLALALKLLGIRAAKALGVPYIRTGNDSNNGPMLAINRKLGFVSEPGEYYMQRVIRKD
jgi:RimJ/RimL family protein N-acetyltransferase